MTLREDIEGAMKEVKQKNREHYMLGLLESRLRFIFYTMLFLVGAVFGIAVSALVIAIIN